MRLYIPLYISGGYNVILRVFPIIIITCKVTYSDKPETIFLTLPEAFVNFLPQSTCRRDEKISRPRCFLQPAFQNRREPQTREIDKRKNNHEEHEYHLIIVNPPRKNVIKQYNEEKHKGRHGNGTHRFKELAYPRLTLCPDIITRKIVDEHHEKWTDGQSHHYPVGQQKNSYRRKPFRQPRHDMVARNTERYQPGKSRDIIDRDIDCSDFLFSGQGRRVSNSPDGSNLTTIDGKEGVISSLR